MQEDGEGRVSIYYYIAVVCVKIYNFTEISWFMTEACRLDEKHDLGLMPNSFTKEEVELFEEVLEGYEKGMSGLSNSNMGCSCGHPSAHWHCEKRL